MPYMVTSTIFLVTLYYHIASEQRFLPVLFLIFLFKSSNFTEPVTAPHKEGPQPLETRNFGCVSDQSYKGPGGSIVGDLLAIVGGSLVR